MGGAAPRAFTTPWVLRDWIVGGHLLPNVVSPSRRATFLQSPRGLTEAGGGLGKGALRRDAGRGPKVGGEFSTQWGLQVGKRRKQRSGEGRWSSTEVSRGGGRTGGDVAVPGDWGQRLGGIRTLADSRGLKGSHWPPGQDRAAE